MANFDNLNDNIDIIFNKITKNDTLCELIYYPNDLSELENNTGLMYKNIYPFPTIPKIEDEVSSALLVTFVAFNPVDEDVYKKSYINFKVLCNINSWKIEEGGIRPFKILNEIDKMFNNTRELKGIGCLRYEGCVPAESTISNYAGYDVRYSINDINTKNYGGDSFGRP